MPAIMRLRIPVFLLLAVLLGSQAALASGYAIYEAGARASALGGAMVARADDLSAIFFNPAGLTQLPGLQAMAGVTTVMPRTEIVTQFGPVTTRTSMKEEVFFIPHFYASYQVSPSWWVGLGVFSPFGLGVAYDPNWPGRINNINTRITTLNINPNLAFKATDYISLAVGIDVMYFDFESRRALPIPLLGFQDTTMKADSFGLGFNAGIHFKPTNYLSIGLSYRSQVKQFLEGEAKFAPAGFLNAAVQGSVILPDMVFAGVMVKPLPRLTVEVGCIWTRWSLFEKMEMTLKNPLGALSETKNWRDTWRAHLGVEYKAAEWLDLRVGYVFDEEPIRDRYADYIVPASDRHYFSIGSGFHWRQWTLDLSYAFMFMTDRQINNSQATGVLPSTFQGRQAHLIGLSLGYKF